MVLGTAPTEIEFKTLLFTSFEVIQLHCPEYGPPEPPLTTVFATDICPTSITVFERVKELYAAENCAACE
jgi:hypothetical protein